METKPSWYSTGYDSVDREKERIVRTQGPNRFWMKEGTKRKLVFLDDEPFTINEHNPKINGTWRNHFTCLRDVTDMAVCCEKLGERDRYFVGYYTVIDLTERTDTANAKYQFEVQLFPAKLKTLSLLRRKKQDRGSLIGCIFNVHRDSQDDPNCGGEFEFDREAQLDKLLVAASYRGRKITEVYKEASEKPEMKARLIELFNPELDGSGVIVPKLYPFNYTQVLAPRSPQEIRMMLGNVSAAPASAAEEGAKKDDEIPF